MKNNYSFFLFSFFFFFSLLWRGAGGDVLAQSVGIFGRTSLGVNNSGAFGNPSSVFDISSTTGGLLIPRMTTAQRDAIATPALSLLIFNTDVNEYQFYNGSGFSTVAAGAGPWTKSGNDVYLTNPADKVAIGVTTAAEKLVVADNTKSVIANVTASATGNSSFALLRSRGTLASQSAVLSGDNLGIVSFIGHDGTTWGGGASIGANASENFTPSEQGNELSFYTTPNGSIVSQPRMTILNNGTVGIGTTGLLGNGLSDRLEVAGSAEFDGTAYFGAGGAEGIEQVGGSSGGLNWRGRLRLVGNSGDPQFLMFRESGARPSEDLVQFFSDNMSTRVFTINGSGNVGIGTTTPTSLLHIKGTFDPIQISVENTGAAFKTGYHLKTGSGEWFMGQVNNGTFSIKDITANKIRMEIDGSGNVGIGTTAPGDLLHISSANTTFGLTIQNSAAGGDYGYIRGTSNASAEGPNKMLIGQGGAAPIRMTIQGTDGNIGIGTTFPSALLDVSGDGGTILIPRKSTAGDPAGPLNGMIYYNANTDKFRVYENGAWADMVGGSGSGWDLFGNTSTVDGVNFIGTSDDVPLSIRVNNQTAGRIESFSWVGNNFANTALGYQTLVNNSSGGSNSAIGYRALYANTTGTENTANGWGALTSNTTASYNAAFGTQALYLNTLGAENTAIGYQSLSSNTTGSQNTAVGWGSLFSQSFNNGGSAWSANNTAIGYEALYSNQPTATNNGIFNTATGNYSLRSNTTGASNTATGYRALFQNTEGYSNTSIGVNSLENSTTANWNIAVGEDALKNNSTAGNNVAVGNQALLTQGVYNNGGIPWYSNNVAIGHQAMYSNQPTATTDGIQNTAVGNFALWSNNIGKHNSAIGFQSLYMNTTADNNIAIGYNALYSQAFDNGATPWNSNNLAIGNEALFNNAPNTPSNGNENSAIGHFSMLNNTLGRENTALGNFSLYNNTTASRNTALGYRALFLQSFSDAGANYNSYNTAIGYDALYSNNPAGTTDGIENTSIGGRSLFSNSTGHGNVAVGFQAGETSDGAYANTTGSYNIYLGYNSGPGVASSNFENSIAIGKNSKISASNTMALGGTGADAVNVGIGTDAPLATLDVTNDGGTILIPRKSTTGDPAGTDGMIYYNTADLKFRIYENGAWKDWATPAGNPSWELSGNAGTVDGTNFIGTTDDIPFNIRVNNFKAGRIESDDGVNYAGNTFFGFQAGNSNTVNFGLNEGLYNTAIGYQTFWSNTTGYSNTAIGNYALYSNTTGYNNIANGYRALYSNTTGGQNFAIGNYALYYNTSGIANSASGMNAIAYNTTGSFNTANGNNALNSNIAGSGATAIGTSAMLYSNNTSTPFTNYNVAVGYEALRGSAAPASNTGNNNTALGYQTLLSNSSGDQNTASGAQALFSNSTGQWNTATGGLSLYFNNSGSYNTANGRGALYQNVNGGYNTAIGVSAMVSNTAGSENTSSGLNSLYYNTVGNNNTAIGVRTLLNNVAGSNATAIGYNAMYNANNTTTPFTNYNVAVGYEALRGSATPASNTGNYNTSLGYQSLLGNSSGGENIAIGHQALYTNTTGNRSVAVGLNSFWNSNASNNTGVGYNTGGSTNSGVSNTFIGYNAGNANTSGGYNVIMGSAAGDVNATGSNNILIGYNAETAADGYTNAIAIGSNAVVGANNSMVLGNSVNVGIGSTSPVYRLDLGNGTLGFGNLNQRTETRNDAGLAGSAGAQSGMFETSAPDPATNWPAGASSWWHLLDVRHSNVANNFAMQFAGSFFDQKLWFRKTNNNPAQAWVEVLTTANGVDGSGTNNYIPKWTPDGTTLGNSLIYDDGTNVGIGTASPLSKLHTWQSGDVTKYVVRGEASQASTSTDYQNVGVYGYGRGGNAGWGFGAGVMGIGDQANSYFATGVYAGLGSAPITLPTIDAALYANGASLGYSAIFSGGNVGVGTTAAANLLHVEQTTAAFKTNVFSKLTTSAAGLNAGIQTEVVGSGTGNMYGVYNLVSNSGTGPVVGVMAQSSGANSGDKIGGEFAGVGTSGANYGVRGWATGVTAGSNTAGYFSASGGVNNYGLIVPSGGGNVGIGLTAPVNLLDVEGGMAVGAGFSGTNSAPANGMLVQGSVGIGTSSPLSKLHIAGTSQFEGLMLQNFAANNTEPRIILTKSRNATIGQNTIVNINDLTGQIGGWGNDGTNYWPNGTIEFEVDGTPGANDMPGRITFNTTPDGSQIQSERMRIDNTGNVGIGVTNPTSELQVAGSVALGTGTVTGNEPITVYLTNISGAPVSNGMIVVTGGANNSFTTTTTANATNAIGVVYDASIAAGAIGRVAIAGVVLVYHANAIVAGDRGKHVVTSTTAGSAGITATPAAGASIGVVLEAPISAGLRGRMLLR